MAPSLMPHAVCWRQDPTLIWTMVVTNAITFLSYFSICITLFYLSRKTRHAMARDWVFFLVGFALFIVACGTTHFMQVVTTWWPLFWLDAWTNILTAVVSGYVAIQFIRRAPELGFGISDYANRLSNTQNEKAQVEENLLAARKLEEWNRMSAVVTHEINNPLAAIQNLMFLIQISSGTPPEVATMAQQAADEVHRIETLTRSTLGFFRQRPEPERVDLRVSADAVRMLLEPMLRQTGIEVDIQSTGDCTVTAFSVETRQVLLNLVRNACEANPRKGAHVTIAIDGQQQAVVIMIADQGPGIDPAVRSNLYKFGVSTKGDRGNGMGLWLVKQLIDRHGGTIDYESKPGEGTRFTVHWPREFMVQVPPGSPGPSSRN